MGTGSGTEGGQPPPEPGPIFMMHGWARGPCGLFSPRKGFRFRLEFGSTVKWRKRFYRLR